MPDMNDISIEFVSLKIDSAYNIFKVYIYMDEA